MSLTIAARRGAHGGGWQVNAALHRVSRYRVIAAFVSQITVEWVTKEMLPGKLQLAIKTCNFPSWKPHPARSNIGTKEHALQIRDIQDHKQIMHSTVSTCMCGVQGKTARDAEREREALGKSTGHGRSKLHASSCGLVEPSCTHRDITAEAQQGCRTARMQTQ